MLMRMLQELLLQGPTKQRAVLLPGPSSSSINSRGALLPLMQQQQQQTPRISLRLLGALRGRLLLQRGPSRRPLRRGAPRGP